MELDKGSYKNIIENLHDGLYFVDRNRIIQYWNKAAEKISGYKAEEVIGKSCSDNILTHIDRDGNKLCTGVCPLAATISDNIPREAEVFMHHKDGHRVPVSVRVSTLADDKGRIIGGIELFTDISNQEAIKIRIKELEKMAYLDNLTQLANRNFIQKEIHIRFEEIKRFDRPFGLLFTDIDNFKNVNDSYGHDVGDIMLKYVAKTFTLNSRPFDFYGRWGGEEFIGVIRYINGPDLINLGNRMRELIASSYILNNNNQTLQTTVSMGATMSLKGDTVDSLIKRADELLYKSKASGKNCLTFG